MHGQLLLLAQVRVRQPIAHDSRNGVDGGAELALHDHEVVVDGLLKGPYFDFDVGFDGERGVDLFEFIEGDDVEVGGVGVILSEAGVAAGGFPPSAGFAEAELGD